MKKHICKKAAICFCAAGMALFQGTFLSYGGWQRDGQQWRYSPADGGEAVTSAWYQVDGEWYRLDENGHMRTGWHMDDSGQWYFLNPVSDGTKGKMLTGWQWIDGYCYYLAEEAAGQYPLGAMYAGGRTPDGYLVDAGGAWVDSTGSRIWRPEVGIVTKKISNTSSEGENRKQEFIKNSKGSSGNGNSNGNKKGDAHGGSGTGSIQNGGNGDRNHMIWSEGNQADAADQVEHKDHKDHENHESCESNEGQAEHSYDGSKPHRPENENQENGSQENGSQENGGQESGSQEKNVAWQVHFTDQLSHQIHLAPSRSGIVKDNTNLTIYFQTRIIDAENRVWESLQKSPYIITVSGPQNNIIYVEYRQTTEIIEGPEDSWQQQRKQLEAYMETARKQEAEFLGVSLETVPDSRFLAEDKKRCDLRIKSAASRINEGETGIFYVIGKNYIPEASILAELYGSTMEYSNTVEGQVALEQDTYYVTRFHLYRKAPNSQTPIVWTGTEKRHWQLGDIQERELDGVRYRFRCIDQNFGDETDRSRQKALFLCDTVIPADTGSTYSYGELEDGSYGYRFHPGPIVSFGDSDSYKHSSIRSWFKKAEQGFGEISPIASGVTYAYEGSTKAGSRQLMVSQGLKARYIGSQTMTDGLFLLSVDEAFKYRSWLWRFEGAEEENPEDQQGSFCKSYWLRTPFGGRNTEEGGMVYVVDLIQGNIHPQPVKPKGDSGDEELKVTGTTGVRPAFTVWQN